MRTKIKRSKKIRSFLIAVLLILLTGCVEAESGGSWGLLSASGQETVIEDYEDSLVCFSGSGYYFFKSNPASPGSMNLRYLDAATGKEIALCSRPECRHDGNSLCVATNQNFYPFGLQLYGGALYMGAIYSAESTLQFKVMKIALDGSSMTEVVTYFETPKTGTSASEYRADNKMLIHRGRIFLSLALGSENRLEDTLSTGAAVYDLATGKLTFQNKEHVSKDNPQWLNMTPHGDKLYYSAKTGHSQALHCYHLDDGSDEELLQKDFYGNFAVLDDETIFFTGWRSEKLFMRHPDGSVEALGTMNLVLTLVIRERPEDFMEFPYDMEAGSLKTDGEFLYIPCKNIVKVGNPNSQSDVDHFYEMPADKEYFIIYDRSGKRVKDLAVTVPTYESKYGVFYQYSFHKDLVSLEINHGEETHFFSDYFRCTRDAFFTGEDPFEEKLRIVWY